MTSLLPDYNKADAGTPGRILNQTTGAPGRTSVPGRTPIPTTGGPPRRTSGVVQPPAVTAPTNASRLAEKMATLPQAPALTSQFSEVPIADRLKLTFGDTFDGKKKYLESIGYKVYRGADNQIVVGRNGKVTPFDSGSLSWKNLGDIGRSLAETGKDLLEAVPENLPLIASIPTSIATQYGAGLVAAAGGGPAAVVGGLAASSYATGEAMAAAEKSREWIGRKLGVYEGGPDAEKIAEERFSGRVMGAIPGGYITGGIAKLAPRILGKTLAGKLTTKLGIETATKYATKIPGLTGVGKVIEKALPGYVAKTTLGVGVTSGLETSLIGGTQGAWAAYRAGGSPQDIAAAFVKSGIVSGIVGAGTSLGIHLTMKGKAPEVYKIINGDSLEFPSGTNSAPVFEKDLIKQGVPKQQASDIMARVKPLTEGPHAGMIAARDVYEAIDTYNEVIRKTRDELSAQQKEQLQLKLEQPLIQEEADRNLVNMVRELNLTTEQARAKVEEIGKSSVEEYENKFSDKEKELYKTYLATNKGIPAMAENPLISKEEAQKNTKVGEAVKIEIPTQGAQNAVVSAEVVGYDNQSMRVSVGEGESKRIVRVPYESVQELNKILKAKVSGEARPSIRAPQVPTAEPGRRGVGLGLPLNTPMVPGRDASVKVGPLTMGSRITVKGQELLVHIRSAIGKINAKLGNALLIAKEFESAEAFENYINGTGRNDKLVNWIKDPVDFYNKYLQVEPATPAAIAKWNVPIERSNIVGADNVYAAEIMTRGLNNGAKTNIIPTMGRGRGPLAGAQTRVERGIRGRVGQNLRELTGGRQLLPSEYPLPIDAQGRLGRKVVEISPEDNVAYQEASLTQAESQLKDNPTDAEAILAKITAYLTLGKNLDNIPGLIELARSYNTNENMKKIGAKGKDEMVPYIDDALNFVEEGLYPDLRSQLRLIENIQRQAKDQGAIGKPQGTVEASPAMKDEISNLPPLEDRRIIYPIGWKQDTPLVSMAEMDAPTDHNKWLQIDIFRYYRKLVGSGNVEITAQYKNFENKAAMGDKRYVATDKVLFRVLPDDGSPASPNDVWHVIEYPDGTIIKTRNLWTAGPKPGYLYPSWATDVAAGQTTKIPKNIENIKTIGPEDTFMDAKGEIHNKPLADKNIITIDQYLARDKAMARGIIAKPSEAAAVQPEVKPTEVKPGPVTPPSEETLGGLIKRIIKPAESPLVTSMTLEGARAKLEELNAKYDEITSKVGYTRAQTEPISKEIKAISDVIDQLKKTEVINLPKEQPPTEIKPTKPVKEKVVITKKTIVKPEMKVPKEKLPKVAKPREITVSVVDEKGIQINKIKSTPEDATARADKLRAIKGRTPEQEYELAGLDAAIAHEKAVVIGKTTVEEFNKTGQDKNVITKTKKLIEEPINRGESIRLRDVQYLRQDGTGGEKLRDIEVVPVGYTKDGKVIPRIEKSKDGRLKINAFEHYPDGSKEQKQFFLDRFSNIPDQTVIKKNAEKGIDYLVGDEDAFPTQRSLQNTPETDKVLKGKKGIIKSILGEQIRNMNMSAKESSNIVRFINLISDNLFDNVGLKLTNKVGGQKQSGQYEYAKNLITIFRDSIKTGKFDRTTIHELWHSLARYLPGELTTSINKQFLKERATYIKENPWFQEVVNNPKGMSWAKRNEIVDKYPEALQYISAKQNDEGLWTWALKSDVNYKFKNIDEWFAETLTDKSLERLKEMDQNSRNIFLHMKNIVRNFIRGVQNVFGGNHTDKILNNYLQDKYKTTKRDYSLADDILIKKLAKEHNLSEDRVIEVLGDKLKKASLAPGEEPPPEDVWERLNRNMVKTIATEHESYIKTGILGDVTHTAVNKLKTAIEGTKKMNRIPGESYESYSKRIEQIGAANVTPSGTKQMRAAGAQRSEEFGWDSIRGSVTPDEETLIIRHIQEDKALIPEERARARAAIHGLLDSRKMLIPTDADLFLLEKTIGRDVVESILGKESNKSLRKISRVLLNIINIKKSIKASGDLSWLGTNGMFELALNPKAVGSGIKDQLKVAFNLKDWGGDKQADAEWRKIVEDPIYIPARRAGVRYVKRDSNFAQERGDAFQSSYAEKIPLLGNVIIKRSNGAWATMANRVMQEEFRQQYKLAKKITPDIDDNLKELKKLGDTVNNFMGRSSVGPAESLMPFLSTVMWSPRNTTSLFKLPFNLLKGGPAGKVAAKRTLRGLISYVALQGATIGMAELAGFENDYEPTSTHFLQTKVPGTNVWGNIPNPYRILLRTLARIYYGQEISGTGKLTTYGKGYKPMSREDAIFSFLENKQTPIVELSRALLNGGKDSLGRTITLSGELTDTFTTMVMDNLAEIWEEDPSLAPLELMEILGGRVDTPYQKVKAKNLYQNIYEKAFPEY